MSNKAKVTVVIPNYNGLKFMDPCFKALNLQLCRDFDILVVDNGSTDGSVEWLKEHEIPSIFLEKNTGFSGAVNVGIKASKTPYVILLNNDTEPDCHYIGEMIKAIERSPKIFSVSSKMIQLYDHSKMDDAGDMYTLLGWAFQRGVGRPATGYNRSCSVFSACAGAAIYRREVFETIGYLTRCILLIWKILMWVTGRRFMVIKMFTAQAPWYTTWEVVPVDPVTIHLRSVWQQETIFI